MLLSEFDFDLPPDLIALRPAAPRDSARLLCVSRDGALWDRSFAQLPTLLAPGDALVFNDTRVIAARLKGFRIRGASSVAVQATLHQRLDPGRWTAFMRPGKRLAAGDRIHFGALVDRGCAAASLSATVAEKADGGEVTLAFDLAGPDLDLAISAHGEMPLPPYIATLRQEDAQDRIDYQTVYARHDGSVAAPTAGLHFTAELLDAFRARGVSSHFVTLHVGAGTFLPVKTDSIADHRMHAETGILADDTAEALNAVRRAGGRIVCVGTTAVRLLESAADESGRLHPFAGSTAIFITPGYKFRVAEGMITNFHLPKSTLFMLVSAFSGQGTMRRAYAHAVAERYRFYSYGDASLLWRAGE